MTVTAAAFRESRICVSFSGENLQFLYCVLASYNGFFAGEPLGDTISAAIELVPLSEPKRKQANRRSRVDHQMWLYTLLGIGCEHIGTSVTL